MIFSLPPALIKTTDKVIYNEKPVAYSWGNIDALNKWLISQNQNQIEKALDIDPKRKYPLMWLVEGWQCNEVGPALKFEKVTFWISYNSKVETLNENRDFTIQYKVANELIKKLELVFHIAKDSLKWSEKTNVSVSNESAQADIWDSVILTLDLMINKNCTRKLYV